MKPKKTGNKNRNLSERETEILQIVAEGFSNKQIAGQLGITDYCVDKHNRSVVKKLKAKNMKHAITIGMREKIIK